MKKGLLLKQKSLCYMKKPSRCEARGLFFFMANENYYSLIGQDDIQTLFSSFESILSDFPC